MEIHKQFLGQVEDVKCRLDEEQKRSSSRYFEEYLRLIELS
jgi:hypothetical protein